MSVSLCMSVGESVLYVSESVYVCWRECVLYVSESVYVCW